MTSENIIKVANYPFTCPRCGLMIKRGENFIESDGVATCVCVMPVRKLIATGIRRLLTNERAKK